MGFKEKYIFVSIVTILYIGGKVQEYLGVFCGKKPAVILCFVIFNLFKICFIYLEIGVYKKDNRANIKVHL